MNIVVDGIVYELQSYGGISRLFSEILPRICDIDENLCITLLTSSQCKQPLPRHPHIQHRSIPKVERLLRPIRLWSPIIPATKGMFRRLYLFTAKQGIWHSTYFTLPADWGVLSWKGQSVVTVHDMIYEKFPGEFRDSREFIERKKLCIEQADRIIAVSENTRRDILEYIKIPESKISVVHNASSDSFKEMSDSEKSRMRKQLKLDKPFILYVGHRIRGYKNFQTLLKAYSLWKRRGDFELICVGGTPSWEEEDIGIITKSNLLSSVRLFLNVDDRELRALYSLAYAFVFPSLYEGFGIPPLEAMACGTPVIASNASSIPEVVGDAGLYFAPSSKDELLNALDRIADDSALREGLVKKGLERSNIFSWNKTAAKTYNVYRDISLARSTRSGIHLHTSE